MPVLRMWRPKEVKGTKSAEPSNNGHHFRKHIASKIDFESQKNNPL
jgi:hypothetical protein